MLSSSARCSSHSQRNLLISLNSTPQHCPWKHDFCPTLNGTMLVHHFQVNSSLLVTSIHNMSNKNGMWQAMTKFVMSPEYQTKFPNQIPSMSNQIRKTVNHLVLYQIQCVWCEVKAHAWNVTYWDRKLTLLQSRVYYTYRGLWHFSVQELWWGYENSSG
jgi:hypothetical protein